MANSIYLTLNGVKQGLISQSCCSIDSIGNKHQAVHNDQIFIYSLEHMKIINHKKGYLLLIMILYGSIEWLVPQLIVFGKSVFIKEY